MSNKEIEEIIKMIPDKCEISFALVPSGTTIMENGKWVTYVIWGITNHENVWVEMEDSTGFMDGRYYSPLCDVNEEVLKFIKKLLERKDYEIHNLE